MVPRVIKNESPCRDINTNDLRHDAFAQIRFHPLSICVFLTLCTQLEQSRTLQILPRIVRTQCLERQFKGVLISELKKKKKANGYALLLSYRDITSTKAAVQSF